MAEYNVNLCYTKDLQWQKTMVDVRLCLTDLAVEE